MNCKGTANSRKAKRMEVYLIRHLMTQGNVEKRYIGTTDEPLILIPEQEGLVRRMREKLKTASVDTVVSSPMKRCVQTAEIYFPGQEPVIQEKLRESDFGLFENKNYEELKDEPEYQKWLDSGGTIPFPGGESHEAFLKRCREGFLENMEQLRQDGADSAAFVIHGGTVMAVLSGYSERESSFYDWMIPNGTGYQAVWDETDRILRKIEKMER